MAGMYALASQNMIMQQMLQMDNEIGSHTKCPKLMKFSDFAKWEPRFRAHLGSVHPECSSCLDELYTVPMIGDETTGYTKKAPSQYSLEEKKAA